MCGAEGSLAFITEAKLNLTRIPKARTLVNIKYDSFESALRNAPLMVQANALSVETVDSKVLNLAKQDIVWHSVKELITDVPGKEMQGINIVEFADQDQAQVNELVSKLVASLDETLAQGEAGIIGYQVCDDLPSINRIYGMRKKAVGLLGAAKVALNRFHLLKILVFHRSIWRTTLSNFAHCLILKALPTGCLVTWMPGCCTFVQRWICVTQSKSV